jgi:hypothetical protein
MILKVSTCMFGHSTWEIEGDMPDGQPYHHRGLGCFCLSHEDCLVPRRDWGMEHFDWTAFRITQALKL